MAGAERLNGRRVHNDNRKYALPVFRKLRALAFGGQEIRLWLPRQGPTEDGRVQGQECPTEAASGATAATPPPLISRMVCATLRGVRARIAAISRKVAEQKGEPEAKEPSLRRDLFDFAAHRSEACLLNSVREHTFHTFTSSGSALPEEDFSAAVAAFFLAMRL